MNAMRYLTIVLLLTCAPLFNGPLNGQQSAPNRAGSVFVIDGDTFVHNGERIRLYGIDAPEISQTCDGVEVGRMARAELQRLVEQPCTTQPFTISAKGTDKYGRTLAVVTNCCGVNVNREMVRLGFAYPYLRYTHAFADAADGHGPVYDHHCINPENYRRTK